MFFWQNFLRAPNQKSDYNLVSETLLFLDCICGSTTGGLGLIGLYINEHNVVLINQTLETLTEYCQGPCHENQNCIGLYFYLIKWYIKIQDSIFWQKLFESFFLTVQNILL